MSFTETRGCLASALVLVLHLPLLRVNVQRLMAWRPSERAACAWARKR
jgi:hypothetical protein